MASFDEKRISDPVHGTIGLSKLEVEIINTPAFQRLRNVKQLGLAHMVYPGADYSRFSHSIGVCHVVGRLMEALRLQKTGGIDEATMQQYRLAGLLHDVGHYPFSHAMEDALDEHFSRKSLRSRSTELGDPSLEQVPDSEAMTHERVGKRIVESDPMISEILRRADVDPQKVTEIFTRERKLDYSNVVSSDLDADRIDYLLRTAHHTGLPYGSTDLNYLVTQVRLDNVGRVCFSNRAW